MMTPRTRSGNWNTAVCLTAILCGSWYSTLARGGEGKQDARPAEKPAPKLDRSALEKQFQETMSGAVLNGSFSIVGTDGKQTVSEEKYTIGKVSKLNGDTWVFETRIQYGGNDVKVPLPLTVYWAGDTPVISLTDLTIPGLGTFTSRVMVYRGRYAGTWQHGEVGGHLWGRVEKASDAEKNNKDAEKNNKKGDATPGGEKKPADSK
jgi:hypothetical protein